MTDKAPQKVLFGHTPKAAGSHIIEYFRRQLRYPVHQSNGRFDNGVWRDFSIGQLLAQANAEHAFVCSHTLALGWSELVESIPYAGQQTIIDTLRAFRAQGWLTFTFVRHPGELLTSFYYYILDAHQRGWDEAVALHAPAVGRPLNEFIAEHCDKELVPAYWRQYDYANQASNANLHAFFARYFDHQFIPGAVDAHASGSRGYAHYCKSGEISASTQDRIEQSRNMAIYREILAAHH